MSAPSHINCLIVQFIFKFLSLSLSWDFKFLSSVLISKTRNTKVVWSAVFNYIILLHMFFLPRCHGIWFHILNIDCLKVWIKILCLRGLYLSFVNIFTWLDSVFADDLLWAWGKMFMLLGEFYLGDNVHHLLGGNLKWEYFYSW